MKPNYNYNSGGASSHQQQSPQVPAPRNGGSPHHYHHQQQQHQYASRYNNHHNNGGGGGGAHYASAAQSPVQDFSAAAGGGYRHQQHFPATRGGGGGGAPHGNNASAMRRAESMNDTTTAQSTTGMIVDLSTHVEVYSATEDCLLVIPRSDIVALPAATAASSTPVNSSDSRSSATPTDEQQQQQDQQQDQDAAAAETPSSSTPTAGAQQPPPVHKLQLCPSFRHDAPDSCPHGANCQFVHARVANAVAHDIHVNYAWSSPEEVTYERFPAGQMLLVAPPNAQQPSDEIPCHLVLKTRALQSNRRVISHCAHYYFNRMCNRGSACFFIHAVSIVPGGAEAPTGEGAEQQQGQQQGGYAAQHGAPGARVWGRTQLRRSNTSAAAAGPSSTSSTHHHNNQYHHANGHHNNQQHTPLSASMLSSSSNTNLNSSGRGSPMAATPIKRSTDSFHDLYEANYNNSGGAQQQYYQQQGGSNAQLQHHHAAGAAVYQGGYSSSGQQQQAQAGGGIDNTPLRATPVNYQESPITSGSGLGFPAAAHSSSVSASQQPGGYPSIGQMHAGALRHHQQYHQQQQQQGTTNSLLSTPPRRAGGAAAGDVAGGASTPDMYTDVHFSHAYHGSQYHTSSSGSVPSSPQQRSQHLQHQYSPITSAGSTPAGAGAASSSSSTVSPTAAGGARRQHAGRRRMHDPYSLSNNVRYLKPVAVEAA